MEKLRRAEFVCFIVWAAGDRSATVEEYEYEYEYNVEVTLPDGNKTNTTQTETRTAFNSYVVPRTISHSYVRPGQVDILIRGRLLRL